MLFIWLFFFYFTVAATFVAKIKLHPDRWKLNRRTDLHRYGPANSYLKSVVLVNSLHHVLYHDHTHTSLFTEHFDANEFLLSTSMQVSKTTLCSETNTYWHFLFLSP